MPFFKLRTNKHYLLARIIEKVTPKGYVALVDMHVNFDSTITINSKQLNKKAERS